MPDKLIWNQHYLHLVLIWLENCTYTKLLCRAPHCFLKNTSSRSMLFWYNIIYHSLILIHKYELKEHMDADAKVMLQLILHWNYVAVLLYKYIINHYKDKPISYQLIWHQNYLYLVLIWLENYTNPKLLCRAPHCFLKHTSSPSTLFWYNIIYHFLIWIHKYKLKDHMEVDEKVMLKLILHQNYVAVFLYE